MVYSLSVYLLFPGSLLLFLFLAQSILKRRGGSAGCWCCLGSALTYILLISWLSGFP